MMADRVNRYFLEVIRLLADRTDALAWASLIELTAGIGEGFVDRIYVRARAGGVGFGEALLVAHAEGFADAPAVSRGRATALADRLIPWLGAHEPPAETPDEGWGRWSVDLADGDVLPEPTPEFRDLLLELDTVAESGQELGRFTGQVHPLGEDLASARSGGVRIMGMGRAKGLTVKATIVVAVEDNVIPRPEADVAEERRLLYVAMTRARTHLFMTWARRRRGPTAWSGKAQVGERRNYSPFLDGGPVQSADGPRFLRQRWPRNE